MRKVGSHPPATTLQTLLPVVLQMLTPPKTSQSLLEQVSGVGESRFYEHPDKSWPRRGGQHRARSTCTDITASLFQVLEGMPKNIKTKYSSWADSFTRASDQEMPRQEHAVLSIGSTALSPSRLQATLPLPLWGFNCINRSYLPDTQLHCCQQQRFPRTQSHQETTKEKTKPSFLRSWTIPINAPKTKHFPGPRAGYHHTALRVPRCLAPWPLFPYPSWKSNPC